MSEMIGHNGGPTFDDIAQENRDRGVLVSMKEVIVEAVRDPRLDRRHLRVLAEVMACMNHQTAQAYPGRAILSKNMGKWDPPDGPETFGYTEAGIAKTLSELVEYGYLVTIKRAPERGMRALSIYTIRKPPLEDLEDQITAWIMAQRMASKRPHPVAFARRNGAVATSNVTSPRNVTSQGHNSGADVTWGGNVSQPVVTSIGNVTSPRNVTSDVTYVDRTGTRRKELERTDEGASARHEVPPLPEPPVYPPALTDEEHKGHGVYVNGKTIRHPAFAVSLEGIRMGTINSGLTANEVRDLCVAHALQWAVEIENGTRPDKVLPSKIANFLCRSIMGEINQKHIHEVRKARESQPLQTRGGTPSLANGAEKIETRAERLARMATEIEQKGQAR